MHYYLTGCVISFLVFLGFEFGRQPVQTSHQPLPAQNPIQPLARTSQILRLPTTISAIKTSLNRPYDYFEREDFDKNPGGWGNRYAWWFPNGLVLTAQSDGQTAKPNAADPVRAILLTASRKFVPTLPGLVLNQTTMSACQARFRATMQPAKSALLGERGAYRIRQKGIYMYLIFNGKDVLIALWQTTFDLETAG